VVFVVKAILTRFWERNHGALKIVEITLKAIQSVVKRISKEKIPITNTFESPFLANFLKRKKAAVNTFATVLYMETSIIHVI